MLMSGPSPLQRDDAPCLIDLHSISLVQVTAGACVGVLMSGQSPLAAEVLTLSPSCLFCSNVV